MELTKELKDLQNTLREILPKLEHFEGLAQEKLCEIETLQRKINDTKADLEAEKAKSGKMLNQATKDVASIHDEARKLLAKAKADKEDSLHDTKEARRELELLKNESARLAKEKADFEEYKAKWQARIDKLENALQ